MDLFNQDEDEETRVVMMSSSQKFSGNYNRLQKV